MRKIELLAPAGSLQKLRIAIKYGADAVYAGGKNFSLRAFAENFSLEDFRAGAEFAHASNAKIYATLNIYARDSELAAIGEYAKELFSAGVDAVLVSDLGVLETVKKAAPKLEIHISTQANTVNSAAVRAWKDLGANRVVLARELSLSEISEISKNVPDVELEAFIHGAMCISYSGRCLLSNYLTGRDSNAGECAQPCRWEYKISETKRPDQEFEIREDERGTYILNSKDLCLINRVPDYIKAGITSFKIEGRVKSEYYVATAVSAYRKAIDAYLNGSEINEDLYSELCKVSHRRFFEGFADGRRDDSEFHDDSGYIREYEYSAIVIEYNRESGLALCEQRNKFEKGDMLEAIIPGRGHLEFKAEKIFDAEMNEIKSTPHAMMKFYIEMPEETSADSLIRKKLV